MSEIDELKESVAALSHRVTLIEDQQAIRKLHYAYGYYIDYNWPHAVADLFAENGEVIFLSGIYRGRDSIYRLYGTWFQEFFTHSEPGPVDGFLLDHFQMQDIITVAEDGQTAKGRFRALLAGGNHESRDYHPEGLPEQFYEAGIYENDYVKEDGVWKIKRLDYVVQWQAEYADGWAKTESHLQPAVETYPGNPLGPDELLPEQRLTWPHRSPLHMHYAHPVIGKAVRG
ncbi:nuclear transport factor 2 family protein [Parasphingopyxis marina]|uniref:Nuclear transport factor 2 family protein n=1 Tax=Parasphingopyxis marina TaxID=2761622 RepID=A0A842HWT2_9SPHN|nr:nuclear transport factor 2 family protein [Parasphingopyxis marina]MBC2778588.1 nuclear transport factor 2 family protein [Parasphingopyxis marina]